MLMYQNVDFFHSSQIQNKLQSVFKERTTLWYHDKRWWLLESPQRKWKGMQYAKCRYEVTIEETIPATDVFNYKKTYGK